MTESVPSPRRHLPP